MNLPSSIPIMRSQRSLFIAGALGLLVLSNSAQAVVTVTFAQSGSNVTATLSGSFLVPSAADRFLDDEALFVPGSVGTPDILYALVSSSIVDYYIRGQTFSSGLSQDPDSFSGTKSFGYDNFVGGLYVDGSSVSGGTLTPTGTWTWNNTTLAGIGLGALTTTPKTVYRAAPSSDDTIQFVAVPEPSAVLLGVASAGLLLRRRRRAL